MLWILRLHQDSADFVFDDLRNPPDGRSHDRFPRGHRFEYDNAESFLSRRENQKFAAVQQSCDLCCCLGAEKLVWFEFPTMMRGLPTPPAVDHPREYEIEGRVAVKQWFCGAQQDVDSLVLFQITDTQNVPAEVNPLLSRFR